MKELSIEEKAKRYDEALEVLHKYDGVNIMFSQSLKEEMFPELKESEDERIKKALISFLKSPFVNESITDEKVTPWIAWLEKQGEKKPEVKYVYTKFRIGDIIVEIKPNGYCPPVRVKYVGEGAYSCESDDGKRFLSFSITMQDKYKLVEQKPADKVEPKFKVGDTIYYNSFGELKSMIVANVVTDSTDNPMYEDKDGNSVFEKDLIEQKSADKKGMNLVEEEMTPFQKEVFCIIDTTIEEEQGLKQVCDKLFSLASNEIKQKHAETEKGAKGNDREIPNSAWSKDDEYYYGIIQYCLNNEIVGKADKENAISWFQSLKERCTWKPCDLPHWQKSNLPNHTSTGFNSDYFCHKGYCINYKELFEKLPKDD